MDKLIDQLFNNLIIRHILSFIFPGFFILAVTYLVNYDSNFIAQYTNRVHVFQDVRQEIFYIVIFCISYIIGMSINFLRDFYMFTFLYKKPDNFIRCKSHYIANVNEWYSEYQAYFRNAPEEIKSIVERSILLMQVAGNIVLSIAICAFIAIPDLSSLFKAGFMPSIPSRIVAIFLIILLIFFAHMKFRQLIDFVKIGNQKNESKGVKAETVQPKDEKEDRT